jgi:GNAT superfamily N-acetyltransferase
MSRLEVRPARDSDVDLLFALIRELAAYEKLSGQVTGNAEALREHLFGDRPYAQALIGEIEGVAVGYALFFPTYSTFLARPGIWLEDLFVLPAHRACGLGKALLAQVAATAVASGCGRLEWSVLDWNEPSIAFYRSLGAAPVDGWTNYRLSGDALAAAARGRG